MKIPKLLHLTWKTHVIPERYKLNLHSWESTHPDWKIQIWSDHDIRQLICSRYPDFLQIFDNYGEAIMKADAFRYFVLHHHGGVYSDLDIFARQNLCPLIQTSTCFLTLEPDSHLEKPKAMRRGLEFIACNALMGSTANHPFWTSVFKMLRRQADVPYVLDATGPFMLTGATLDCSANHRPDLIPPHAWSPTDAESVDSSSCCADIAQRRGFNVLGKTRDSRTVVYVEHQWHSNWHRDKPSLLSKAEAAVRKLKYAWRQSRYGDLDFSPTPPPVPIHTQAHHEPSRLPRLAIATPIKQGATHLGNYKKVIEAIEYPAELIELYFVVSDSDDGTQDLLQELQRDWRRRFRRVKIEEINFNFKAKLPRWDASIQRQRRANIAVCRNRLAEMSCDSEYVLFLDVDLASVPADIIQRLLGAEAPVVMANCVDEEDRVFDLNSFFYEHEPTFSYKWKALKDGLFQPAAKWPRMYLSDVAYLNKVPLDCVGGTCLLVKNIVFKNGVRFPTEPFRFHIETEGFSLMARDHGFEVLGLPNTKVVHLRQ